MALRTHLGHVIRRGSADLLKEVRDMFISRRLCGAVWI